MSLLKKSVNYLTLFYLLFLGLLLLPLNSYASYAPSLKWYTIETDNFLIHYHNGLKSSAEEIASLTPEIHKEVTEFFNWVPKDKTHIILSNQSENPNGSASVLPYNRIELLMTPPSDVSGLEDYQNWQKLLLKHEYVHIVNLDKGEDLFLDGRSILGRYFLFFPNTFMPRWISEGLATFLETDDQLKIGRGQSNYYRGLMRNEVIHGIKSLSQINQKRSEWPSGTGYYLYGVYFFNFIRDTYGEDKIREFVDQYSYFPVPYFINFVTKKTFGKNLFSLWNEFDIYLNNEFATEIQEKELTDQVRRISNSGYYSGFSQVTNNKLYYIRSNREKLKTLIERDITNNKERIITTIIRQDSIFPQAFDIHPDNGILIPLLERYENFQESFDLYLFSTATNKRTQLTKNKRYIRAVWNKKGDRIIALSNINGKHKLDLLSNSGKFIKTLWEGESGFTINAFDWSPIDNTLVVSLFTPNQGWNLNIFNIDNGSWHNLTNNASIETYPQFDKTGNLITYSADYNGIYNAYQLNRKTNIITQLTDSKTVALFPSIDRKNKKIYFTELDKGGFNLKESNLLTEKTILITAQVDKALLPKQSPDFIQASINAQKIEPIQTLKTYNGLKYLAPSWILPVYVADTNQSSFGLFSSTSDPLNWHTYNAQILFDTKNDEFRWNVNYLNQKNATYFILSSRQESFNSKILERRDNETAAALIRPYIKQNYTWQIFSSIRYIESLFSIPNTPINLTLNDFNFTSGVSIDTTSKNLVSVSDHDGIKVSLSYEVNEVETTIAQHSRISLYGGIFSAPVKHAVFEASGVIVSAGNNAKDTYLGGAGINEFSKTGFGKDTFSLYGYSLNQFINTNMQKISLKLHYPLFYPDIGFMRPPLGVNRFNLNIIAEQARIGTFSTINSQQWLSSAAMELNVNANFGFGRYPFSLTAGIAKGFSEFGELVFYHNVGLNF